MTSKEIIQVKYEYERAFRFLENLKKNYERRKKFNLIDDKYSSQILPDLQKAESEVAYLKRRIRALESEETRAKIIHGE